MIRADLKTRFDRNVIRRLRGLGRRFRFYLAVDGVAVSVTAILFAVVITLLVDRAFLLDRDMRVVQLFSLLAALAVIIWRYLVQPLRLPVRLTDLARLIEENHPELHSRLISAVDFAAIRNPAPHHSTAMMESVVADLDAEVGGLRFHQPLNHLHARRMGTLLLVCVAAMTVLVAVERDTMGLWFRRNVLLENVQWPRQNSLIVEGLENGVLRVPRGDDIAIAARVEEGYEAPLQVFIDYDLNDGVSGREQMVATTSQGVRFSHTFERVSRDMRCRITGGDARPDPFRIEVVDRPRVSNVVISIEPPAYTRSEPYDLRPGQTVAEALRGSRIGLRITTQKPVAEAILVRQSGGVEERVGPARPTSETEFHAEDLPEQSATYHFDLTDSTGMTNRSERVAPVRFSVRLLADRPPQVKLKIRGAGEMITPEAVLPVEMDFNDTYGIAATSLVHTISQQGEKAGENQEITNAESLDGFEPGTVTYTHTRDWALPAHEVKEGDRLVLHAEASDFDDVGGPNVGESTPFSFRLVSREELLAELNRREQEYRQDFERLIRRQQDLRAEVARAASNAVQELTIPDAREWGMLARRQRDHAGRVNTLRMQFEQILSELRINQLSTPGIEVRLGEAIIQPLDAVATRLMPSAAETIDRLSRNPSEQTREIADDALRAVEEQMQRIYENMLKWEGFQEAIALLREVMKIQDELNEETDEAIEKALFGDETAESSPDESQEP